LPEKGLALQQHYVPHATPGQMIGGAGSHHAPTDDDDLRLMWQHLIQFLNVATKVTSRKGTITRIMHAIKLIATDIDGTLLNSQHELTPRVEAALKAAMSRGVQVVLATGKTYNSAGALYDRLGLTTPGVFVQGQVICDPHGQILHQQSLPESVVHDVAGYDAPEASALAMYSGLRVIVSEHNELSLRVTNYHERMPDAVGDLAAYANGLTINKMQFTGAPDVIEHIQRDLIPLLHGQASLVRSVDTVIEILPHGASKGAGLKLVLDDLGIDPQHVLALGDGENDIEMLQLARIGVAMGNAMERLKAVADHVTATNDQDGVAVAVEHFVLNGAGK
jgi:Cof subfamily protein (haloacid dehalogenase superfamily)